MITTYLRNAEALIVALFREAETHAEPLAGELAALRTELLDVQDAIVALQWSGVLPTPFVERWLAARN